MNHQKIYNNIIEKAKKENRKKLRNKKNINYVYYENHHIIPKCLGGGEEKENKVLLRAKEHYVCHKLLTHIHLNNYKIASAFHRMTFNTRIKEHNKTSRDYAYARELISSIPRSLETCKKLSNSLKDKKFTKEHCNNLSKARKGKSWDEFYGKEKADKLKEKRRNKIVSLETRKKLSERGKGRYHKSNYQYWLEREGEEYANKKMHDYKINMSKSLAGKSKNIKIVICPYCGISGGGGNMTRYHFSNCKLKNKMQ